MLKFYLQLFDLSGAFTDIVEKLLSEKIAVILHCQATVRRVTWALRSSLRSATPLIQAARGQKFSELGDDERWIEIIDRCGLRGRQCNERLRSRLLVTRDGWLTL